MTSVLIIDSHEDVRRVLAQRLGASPSFDVVGQTASPFAGIELAASFKPDVVVFDANTRGAYASSLVAQIHRVCPTARIVIFTSFLTTEEEQVYLAAGASECILKGVGFSELCERLLATPTSVNGRQKATPSAPPRVPSAPE